MVSLLDIISADFLSQYERKPIDKHLSGSVEDVFAAVRGKAGFAFDSLEAFREYVSADQERVHVHASFGLVFCGDEYTATSSRNFEDDLDLLKIVYSQNQRLNARDTHTFLFEEVSSSGQNGVTLIVNENRKILVRDSSLTPERAAVYLPHLRNIADYPSYASLLGLVGTAQRFGSSVAVESPVYLGELKTPQ